MVVWEDTPLPGMPPTRAKKPRSKTTKRGYVARSYKGPAATCHACILNVAGGVKKRPRDRATTEIVTDAGSVWLLCTMCAHDHREGMLTLPDERSRKI